jgi:two-component system, OmpR family, KDP operon response regulator KdpE
MVRRDGAEVRLTKTEFELLRLLITNRGRVVTHRVLMAALWGADYAGEVTILRGQMANLRRKIEPLSGARYIRTESGVGYRFLGAGT